MSENDLGDEEYTQDYEIRFPTREVIVTWLPHAGEMLGIAGLGERLPVSGSWPAFTPEAYESGRPVHGTFLPGPISRYRSAHYDDDDDGAEEDAR